MKLGIWNILCKCIYSIQDSCNWQGIHYYALYFVGWSKRMFLCSKQMLLDIDYINNWRLRWIKKWRILQVHNFMELLTCEVNMVVQWSTRETFLQSIYCAVLMSLIWFQHVWIKIFCWSETWSGYYSNILSRIKKRK